MDAGHQVEIVGVTTSDKPATKALTDERVPVTRIQWRTETYRRLFAQTLFRAMIATILALVLLVGFLAFAAIVVSWLSGFVPALTSFFGLDLSNDLLSVIQYPVAIAFLLIVIGLAGIAMLFAIRRIRARAAADSTVKTLITFRKIASNYARFEGESSSGGAFESFMDKLFVNASDDEAATFKATLHARVRAMIEYGLEWEPDIVYCHECATLPVGAKLKAELGARLIYDAHEIYDDLANALPIQTATYKKIHAKYFSKVDEFITVNPEILRYYTNTYEIRSTSVIPNSVFIDPGNPYDGRLHEKALLSQDKKILLYQGGFSPERGLVKLVDAAFRLPEDWYLVMMGWGKLEDELKDRASENKAEAISEYRQERIRQELAEESFLSLVADIKNQHDILSGRKSLGNVKLLANQHSYAVSRLASEKNKSKAMAPDADASFPIQGWTPSAQVELIDYLAQKFIEEHDAFEAVPENAVPEHAVPENAASAFKVMLEGLVEVEKNAHEMLKKNEISRLTEAAYVSFQTSYEALKSEITLKVEKEIARLNNSMYFDKVRFIPGARHSQLVDWTKGATVGVIPYENVGLNHWNCSPNKIWEYANAGLPILASRMNFLNAVIEREDIGWTFASDFLPKDISDAVKSLTDEEIAQKKQNCAIFIKKDNYLSYETKLVELFS
jgi:glycosyltransferase involved in cell wall biosynthesis